MYQQHSTSDQRAAASERASACAREKLGLVLSGGGGRGAFVAGVLERLSREPAFRSPEVVTGTSAGAINAALFASGKAPEEIRDFWLDLGRARVARTNDQFFGQLLHSLVGIVRRSPIQFLKTLIVRHHEHRGLGGPLSNLVELLLADRFDLLRDLLASIQTSYVVDTSRLRARLIDALGGEVIPCGRAALAINVVDACTNRVVRYTNMPTARTRGPEYVVQTNLTVDMVLASASIPIFFPAVRHERRLLWDGGVLSNTPMAPAAALGAERIVTVLVTHDTEFHEPAFANLGQALARLVDMLLENAYNVDRQLLLARNRVAELAQGQESGSHYRKIRLYEAIRPVRDAAFDAGSLLDFDGTRLEVLYHHGQSAASAWLRRGPVEERTEDAHEPVARAAE